LGDAIDASRATHGIKICPLRPHSSNLVPPLDMSTFGITQRLICRVNKMERLNLQSARIAKVVGSFMSAASPPNVVVTFRMAGIALTLQD
jgi:hypothetical protein